MVAVVLAGNERSLRVVARFGMVPDGTRLHAGLEHLHFALERSRLHPGAL